MSDIEREEIAKMEYTHHAEEAKERIEGDKSGYGRIADPALEGKPFTWVFTDVNGEAKEIAGDPVHRSPQDLRIYTALYTHPASAEVERLQARVAELESFINQAPVETGVCMCGEEMYRHSSQPNHTPMDSWDYERDLILRNDAEKG